MGLTHYPKTVRNVVFAWVQPAPPDVVPKKGRPNFVGRPFSRLNRFRSPLAVKDSLFGYHDAQPFTRFYGSVACDQLLDISLAFSNDEVAADGQPVSDDNLASLYYDAYGQQQTYDPNRQEQTGKLFSMIFGRWIRVKVTNIGSAPPTFFRLTLRGSVF